MTEDAYRRSGVDIDAAHRATDLMTKAVQATYGSEVLSRVGSFGGLFDISSLRDMRMPVLVASTDGVGTKSMVAARMKRWDTIGQDLVNHCVNDILVQGARPLFFLDYIASSALDPEQIATVVAGCAEACREAGCALIGGETAELPGVYQPGEIDLVGTVIGVVERDDIIDGQRVQPGDAIIGLPSTGLHTNGYSLARTVLAELDWSIPHDDLRGETIGDALLAVHRSYLPSVGRLLASGVDVRALAHITGGGMVDNLPRVLPAGTGAVIWRHALPDVPILEMIQVRAEISDVEMFRTFNMGLGMLAVVARDHAETAIVTAGDGAELVGEILASDNMRVDIE
jgi:phosphoribosylformylglycinamidine cyclo-ligase